MAPAGVATVVVLVADASTTASCWAWRAPEVRIDSPANAADTLPIEATSANTSNRFMQFLLTDPGNDRAHPVEEAFAFGAGCRGAWGSPASAQPRTGSL